MTWGCSSGQSHPGGGLEDEMDAGRHGVTGVSEPGLAGSDDRAELGMGKKVKPRVLLD